VRLRCVAVTQQLARLAGEQLDECRQSVSVLHRLCSFDLLPSTDHLDLDWAPEPLIRACRQGLIGAAPLSALERALTGAFEVNPAYRDHPNTVWEHPVTALQPDDVADIAGQLERLPVAAVLAGLPTDPGLAASTLGMAALDVHPGVYLHHNFDALRSFYHGAEQQGFAVVLWWD
jgi:hypothetical protein